VELVTGSIRPSSVRCKLAPDDSASGIARRGAELFFDPNQLVIFGETIGPRQRAGLDLPAIGGDARSAIVASSVSPERCDITAP
jgi:hypothetical protein